MARWRLKSAHYLNVPEVDYEVKETHRETGRQITKRFKVHSFYDPDQASDNNYPGETIVTNKADRVYPKDIVFVGPPTPEMEPLDAEAEKISKEWEKKWSHRPVESLPVTMNQG